MELSTEWFHRDAYDMLTSERFSGCFGAGWSFPESIPLPASEALHEEKRISGVLTIHRLSHTPVLQP